MEQSVEIKDFLGVFDGFLTHEYCLSLIQYLTEMERAGMVYSRQELKDSSTLQKNDFTVFIHQAIHLPKTAAVIQPFMKAFWDECYKRYMEQYPILETAGTHGIFSMRLQRTPVGGGYHIWHTEALNKMNMSRIVAFALYLNDVEEGGETEYLYQHRRVKAKEGRMVIWPAGFTHVHRGNTPLSNEKYILTGWLELVA